MKKGKNLGNSLIEETIPVLGDDWQFIYKPQANENEYDVQSIEKNNKRKKDTIR